jgi:methionyl-tRNA formyltransferase
MKNIAVLGSGIEIVTFLEKLYQYTNIVVFGYDKTTENAANDSILFCQKNNIPIINHYTELDNYVIDVVFMLSYPPLIPQNYIDKYWFINLHMALLPKYRGMHGGTWAVINGEKYHGFTVHKVDEGMDSGDIYYQEYIESTLDDDINTIRVKIFDKYANTIKNIFLNILDEKIKAVPQDGTQALFVGRRKPEDSLIDWKDTAFNIFNLVRALTPPYTKGAFTYYKDRPLYITKAKLYPTPTYIATYGQIVGNFKEKGILVKCGDGVLLVEELYYEEKFYLAGTFFKTVGARFCSKLNN